MQMPICRRKNMPDLGKVLKDEIRRLARKEVRLATSALADENRALKRTVSDLKKRVALLERANSRISKHVTAAQAKETQEEAKQAAPRARISSRTIITMREKLGLTQAEFGTLVGVSGQSVYQWERKGGRLRLRHATRTAVLEAKQMGRREARRRLEEVE
jgi:DNA-binding transcriptional regulator YiaG